MDKEKPMTLTEKMAQESQELLLEAVDWYIQHLYKTQPKESQFKRTRLTVISESLEIS
jgi:hypothetical protein